MGRLELTPLGAPGGFLDAFLKVEGGMGCVVRKARSEVVFLLDSILIETSQGDWREWFPFSLLFGVFGPAFH